MAIRWKMSEKETGLSSIGAGPRQHYLKDGEEEVILVYPIGGGWRMELKGYKFKLIGDCFGDKKFNVSKTLFPDYASAKVAAKSFYLSAKKALEKGIYDD
jgi:hypothetical protein